MATATGTQRVERSDEVPVVDRRDRAIGNGRESVGVVPVVEMSAETSPASRWSQGCSQSGGEFVQREKAEGIGSLARVEQKTEVGRRNAGRFKESFFFDIVRDQVIVVAPPNSWKNRQMRRACSRRKRSSSRSVAGWVRGAAYSARS